jgi:hypothetical protein
VLPTFMIPILNRVLQPMTGANTVEALVPPFFASSPAHAQLPSAFAAEFHDLGAQVGQAFLPGEGLVVMHRGGPQNPVVFAMSTSYMLPALLALLAVSYVVLQFGIARRRCLARQPRWDGGLRRLLPEMTYTATGFSNPVRVIFEEILRPIAVVDTREMVAEHFPHGDSPAARGNPHRRALCHSALETRSVESRQPFGRHASRPHQRLCWLWPSDLDHCPCAGPEFVCAVVIVVMRGYFLS